MYSNDMQFVATHEWVKVEADNIVAIGITQHAQELLGDLVYIELPSIGQVIKANQVIGVVESVKAVSDLYAPLNGEVIAINEVAINDPSIVNTQPHTSGWLIKVKLNDLRQLNELLSLQDYQNLIG